MYYVRIITKKGGWNLNFCTECGSELVQNTLYCTQCGHQVQKEAETDDANEATAIKVLDETKTPSSSAEQEEVEVEKHAEVEQGSSATVLSKADEAPNEEKDHQLGAQAEQVEPSQAKEEAVTNKKGSSIWRKLLVGLVIVLILALFGAHKWLESYFDPMNDLVAMDEAVASKDMKTFMSYIEFDENALLNEESYFEIIEEVEWDEAIRQQYFDIIEGTNDSRHAFQNEILDSNDGLLFKVEQNDILFGLYNSLSLVAVPFELKASSNLSPTEVKMEDETIELEAETETVLAEIYPGEFHIEASSEQSYETFTFEESIVIESSIDDVIDIKFESVTYGVQSPYGYEDAELYINGESIGKKINELDELGPFSAESELSIYAVWKDTDGYDVMSNVIHLQDEGIGGSLYFAFNNRNKVAEKLDDEEVGQFILQFRDAYENAVNYLDYTYIKDYLKKDSAAEKELKQFVKDMEDGNYYYDFTENTVLDVKAKKDNKYEVKTNEKFEFRDDDSKWYDYDREKLYYVEKEKDQFVVTKIDYLDTNKDRQ